MDPELLSTCMSGDVEALLILIERDPLILDSAVTCSDLTPLHVAVLRGHLSFVAELLRRRPEMATQRDSSGRVPLHLACANIGSVEIVRELLTAERVDAELSSKARDRCERTPLHLGIMKGRLQVVRELIRLCPGSASERFGRGQTVFHLSLRHCGLEALKLLVDLLRDLHPELLTEVDEDGNTLLHLATLFEQTQIVKYLESLAAERIARNPNSSGHTPIERLENFVNGVSSKMKLPLDWIADAHGNLMVAATVVASMAFQAGVNPPGGVWQEDTTDHPNCSTLDICRAGTAVLQDEKNFHKFYLRNTWALVIAIGVILLQLGIVPFKNKIGTWLLTSFMCLMLHNILAAYEFSARMVVSSKNLPRINILWKTVLGLIMLVHSTRMMTWLMFDKETAFLWKRKNVCITTVLFAASFIVASGMVALVIFL